MTAIIEAIDGWTLNRYGSLYREKLYGFCELMTKTAGEGKTPDTFPVTIPARQKVSLDDRFNFITWLRWMQPATYAASEEFSFGKKEARQGEIPLRLVLAHKSDLGENIATDFVNALPSTFNDISGYKHVFVSPTLSIDPDHESIVQAEIGSTNYEKHRFAWNIYVLNITIQFQLCEVNA
jgi:hypothetical protein